MSQQSAERIKAVTCFWSAWRVMKSILQDEAGVTAIEYGLLAALIVIVATGSIALLGGGVGGMWTEIATKVEAAL